MSLKNQKIEIPKGLKQSRKRFCNFTANTRFDVVNKETVTEIDLYDEIGWYGVDAKEFKGRLKGAKDILLRIHSPGGDVFDGISMHNDLVDHPGRVSVVVPGLAASAASIIAMAGDDIKIAPSAFIMIHNVWTMAVGDRHEMIAMAEMMGEVDEGLTDIYVSRTEGDFTEISEMMDDETWLKGQVAVDSGFADSLTVEDSPKAKFDMSGFKNAPEDWHISQMEPLETIRDFEHLLTREAGLTRSKARSVLQNGITGMLGATGEDDKATRDAGYQSIKELTEVIKNATT